MKNSKGLIELSSDELIDFNGGWNLVEYTVMAAAVVVGALDAASENAADLTDSPIHGTRATHFM